VLALQKRARMVDLVSMSESPRSASRSWVRPLGLMLLGAVLGPVGFLALFAAFDVWNSDENELQGLERRALALEQGYRDFLQYCSSGTGDGRPLRPWLDERRSLDARVPPEVDLQGILKDWRARSAALGVSLSLVDVDKHAREFYWQLRISLELRGHAEALQQLLETMDGSPRILSWERLSWDPGVDPNGRLRAEIDVYARIPARGSSDPCKETRPSEQRFHLPFFASRWRARQPALEKACAPIREIRASPDDLACYEFSGAVQRIRTIVTVLDRHRKRLPEPSALLP
jgi:hypothetical protein